MARDAVVVSCGVVRRRDISRRERADRLLPAQVTCVLPQRRLADLYTVNPRGSPARRIVRAAAQAAWSPDGRRLAVVDCCSDKPAKVLQGAPTVIEPSILSPAWAPDGPGLFGFGCVYGDCGVVIADLDGGATSLLFETGDYSGDMGAEEPEWAPRGALIALTTWGNLNPKTAELSSTTSRLDVFALDPLSTAPTPHGRLTGHGSHSIPPTRTRRRHCPDRP